MDKIKIEKLTSKGPGIKVEPTANVVLHQLNEHQLTLLDVLSPFNLVTE